MLMYVPDTLENSVYVLISATQECGVFLWRQWNAGGERMTEYIVLNDK